MAAWLHQIAERRRIQPGGDSTYFRRNGFRGVLNPAAFAVPDDFFVLLAHFGQQREWVKNSRSTRAALLDGCFVKRYNVRGKLYCWKRLFLQPRPFRCREAAERLLQANLETPRVLAAVEHRGLLPQESYLVTACIPEGWAFLPELDFAGHWREIVRFVAAMHDAGVSHGDLNLRNLYAAPDFSRIGAIDLDGARLYRQCVPAAERRRELARLVSSDLRNHPDADFAAATKNAVALYREFTGLDLGGASLDRRIDYLAHRIRKNEKGTKPQNARRY